jgi:hypothetical protein
MFGINVFHRGRWDVGTGKINTIQDISNNFNGKEL